MRIASAALERLTSKPSSRVTAHAASREVVCALSIRHRLRKSSIIISDGSHVGYPYPFQVAALADRSARHAN